jgi:hypothetical protein
LISSRKRTWDSSIQSGRTKPNTMVGKRKYMRQKRKQKCFDRMRFVNVMFKCMHIWRPYRSQFQNKMTAGETDLHYDSLSLCVWENLKTENNETKSWSRRSSFRQMRYSELTRFIRSVQQILLSIMTKVVLPIFLLGNFFK